MMRIRKRFALKLRCFNLKLLKKAVNFQLLAAA